jgi:AcrR family transcriptional regulator
MPRGEFDRAARRARTRAQLLDAAAQVYAEQGVDRATLDEVAEQAGFTKGAVYDHFGSKDNLLFALLDEYVTAEIAEQLAIFEAHRHAPLRPQIGADRWVEHLEAEPAALRLFVEAWVRGQRDEAVRERVCAWIDAMRELFVSFQRGRAEELGETRSEALLEASADVQSALAVGFALLKLADPERVPSRLLGAAYLVLVGALEASPEARALLEEAAPGRAGAQDT